MAISLHIMRGISAEKYLELYQSAEVSNDNATRTAARRELLQIFPNFNYERFINRAKKLLSVRFALRRETVICFDAPAGVAAYMTPGDARNFANDNLLEESRERIVFVMRHEDQHHRAGIFSLDLTTLPTPANDNLLEAVPGLVLEETALVEGFNDLATMSEDHSGKEISAYQIREVPAAKRLENTAKKLIGVSLLEYYKAGDKGKFLAALTRLGTKLAIRKNLGSVQLAA